jgi:hypothetical protein
MFLQGLKILMVWYFIIDPQLEFRVLYMGGVVVVMGWFVVMFRWQQVGYYNKQLYEVFTYARVYDTITGL